MFASKLTNDKRADHKSIVNEVINKLFIETCADVRPKRCSGGQLKRAIIGMELVANPNILILDEPTTGLDSVTTQRLIELLIALTQGSDPLAIILVIHQPSAKLFNLFNKIYLLSNKSECLYFGPPKDILDYFNQYGLKCPEFTNPADYAIELASGEHDHAKILALMLVNKINALDFSEEKFLIKSRRDQRIFNQVYHLTIRYM